MPIEHFIQILLSVVYETLYSQRNYIRCYRRTDFINTCILYITKPKLAVIHTTAVIHFRSRNLLKGLEDQVCSFIRLVRLEREWSIVDLH